jgi:prepilin peptidase CpaA
VLEPLFLVLLGAVVAVGSWTDARLRRIPNWLCLLNLVLGLAWMLLAAGWAGVGAAALHVVGALAVGMVLTALGVLGAGDAKFYASMAAWLAPGRAIWLLVSVALAGLILLLGFMVWRLARRSKAQADDKSDFAKLPYGLAIGAGGLFAVALT